MALNPEEIADLVVTTEREQGEFKMTEIATDITRHVAMSRLLKKKNVETHDGGTAVEFRIMHTPGDNTRDVGLFSVDNVNQLDGVTKGVVPWRITTDGYTWDRTQLSVNSGKRKILDFIKVKRMQQRISMIQHMEKRFWGEPESSSDDTTPFGVKYWMVYSATEGFNGGNNTNFSAGPAAVDRDVYARWKNYTFQYTNITKDDLIEKMRRAFYQTDFRSPIESPDIASFSTGQRYGWYTVLETLLTMERILEDQNESLGSDVASKSGQVTFRRVPVDHVPFLTQNDATAAPMVGIDWGEFKLMKARGEWMQTDPPRLAPNQHRVMQQFMDSRYNFICRDCRHLILGAKSTWH